MDRFWDALEKSTITSGVVASALIVTACYCVITETPVPAYFSNALVLVFTFFFTSKMKDAALRAKKEQG